MMVRLSTNYTIIQDDGAGGMRMTQSMSDVSTVINNVETGRVLPAVLINPTYGGKRPSQGPNDTLKAQPREL